MEDLFLVAHTVKKAQRQCINPLCGRLLAALNKQDLCFCCHDRLRLNRILGSSAPRIQDFVKASRDPGPHSFH